MLDTSLLPLWVLAAVGLTAIYVYFKVSFSYWRKRGVPILNPTPPFGDVGAAIFTRKNGSELINECYKEFDGKKFGGLYNFAMPLLLVRDPEVIKDILVKDFEKFHSRGIVINEKKEPLQGHLAALSGSKWRNLRVKLSPTFTSGKMKMMFGTLVECGTDLQDCLQEPANNRETIEIKDILARYSTDIIASCAFGVQCNCLKNPDAEFRKWGRKIFEPSSAAKFIRTVTLLVPSLTRLLKVSPKKVTKYFMEMVKETVEYREKNDVKRNDFMQLLIQMKNKTLGVAEEENIKLCNLEEDDLKSIAPFEVTMDVIAAQAFVFFLAGFETSSTTMTFCLYELALNPDIQQRLRVEIDTVLHKHGGNITYESVFEMEYLEKVVDGMRFGLMQTKVGLISLLSRYELRVSEKTPIPLVFDSRSFVLASEGGMWLTVVKRTDK